MTSQQLPQPATFSYYSSLPLLAYHYCNVVSILSLPRSPVPTRSSLVLAVTVIPIYFWTRSFILPCLSSYLYTPNSGAVQTAASIRRPIKVYCVQLPLWSSTHSCGFWTSHWVSPAGVHAVMDNVKRQRIMFPFYCDTHDFHQNHRNSTMIYVRNHPLIDWFEILFR
ncbi:uncharacterized protein BJ212DRAFT_454032 [Suillus subaureus]|uniref:Uncharacterized protein n=1 Tax=Suillus subaureus TaxID=48587 RepID=A0A9P7E684_9AGAM|nr:uncharacterized protein BJ212DRAFT_454032 [Suillus subaureus]KAG1812508.1 hypothetical protein BJ212DRAFT_454032 [Suillus subaureus]